MDIIIFIMKMALCIKIKIFTLFNPIILLVIKGNLKKEREKTMCTNTYTEVLL